MTDEELEMQEAEFNATMEPLLDEVSDFLDNQKKKQNIIMNPRGVAKLNAVYSAICDIMKDVDPEYEIKIIEDSLVKGTFAIELYCDEFIVNENNKKVITLILEHCPTIDVYYTNKKGGKTVLVFEIPKVYVIYPTQK